MTRKLSEPKDTRRARRRAAAADTSSILEEVSVLKMDDDRNFTLDGKFYPLKAFRPEEIYLGEISKVFWDARREKNMGYHSILTRRTRNGGRKKTTAEP